MTQIDPSRSTDHQMMPAIHEAMEKRGVLGESTWITAAVVVVRTETMSATGPHWNTHRLRPDGSLDPAIERAILDDALQDARDERRKR